MLLKYFAGIAASLPQAGHLLMFMDAIAVDGNNPWRNSGAMKRGSRKAWGAGVMAVAVASGILCATGLGAVAAVAQDDIAAPCRRLVRDKWEPSRGSDLEGCLDRLAGSPATYDVNGYKLALWGTVLLATDGIALYQSEDGGTSWEVARQPADVTREALLLAPADPPPLPPETPPPSETTTSDVGDGAQAARYKMWLALARRCDPALPDEGTALRDLQFKASECERRLRQPGGTVPPVPTR